MRIHPFLPEFQLLNSNTLRSQDEVARTLSRLYQRVGKSVRVLLDFLEHWDPVVRQTAGVMIVEVAPDDSDVVWPVAERLLHEQDDQVRNALLAAVGRLRAKAGYLAPRLVNDLLIEGEFQDVNEVCKTLVAIGSDSVAPLIEAVGKHAGCRHLKEAMLTLGALGEEAESAVPTLISILTDYGWRSHVRWATVVALAGIAETSEKARAALCEAASHTDACTTMMGTTALLGITYPSYRPGGPPAYWDLLRSYRSARGNASTFYGGSLDGTAPATNSLSDSYPSFADQWEIVDV